MTEIKLVSSWNSRIALLMVTVLLRIVSGIVVPDMFWHELEKPSGIRGGGDGNRSLIIAETMERYERNRLFSRSMPCIAKFLQDHSMSFRYPMSVFLQNSSNVERGTSVEIDLLVRTLQTETVTYTLNNVYKENDRNANVTSTVIVVVVENSIDIKRINCSYVRMCTYECEFVIIVARIFENDESFFREADALQQSMWLESVGRLVILGSTRETVLLAGTRSFKPEEFCAPSAPVLLGSCRTRPTAAVRGSTAWRLDAGPITGRDLSMNGCTLVVAYYDEPPYSFVNNETTDERILGLEGIMIEEILYSMNARLSREMVSSFSTNKSDEEDFRMIMDQTGDNGPADLLIGGLLWNPNEETDYTMAYDMVPVVWMTPVKANVSLRGLVAPFTMFVWVAILCVIFLGIVVQLFLIKGISFLDILALILGISVFRRPEQPSSRVLFLCWSLFGFFVAQYYLASLADQLVNASNLQIETMKELLSSGLELGGTLSYADLLNDIDEKDDDEEEDLVVRSIREKFRVLTYESYVRQLSDLLNGKDQSMALVVKLNVSNTRLNLLKGHVHALKENMGNHPLAIATWRGFPCLKKINIKMQELLEAGMMKYWARLFILNGNYYRSNENTNSDSDLNLDSVVPGFLLLIIGYLLGFCILIVEIIAYPSKLLA
ncbi:hypothetical protein KPH14_004033 [Odynerus spinipes]|uniref:Uncharacterized protein n=1 Tax=Odynerus spinipes TaxID=1348599 RepID=A0AAD9RXU4_9HYME|nr:hypothetical protein KPH14_004033 [Odynerus spinipes]